MILICQNGVEDKFRLYGDECEAKTIYWMLLSLGNCPPSLLAVNPDLQADRAACTADCNADGFCCTTETGGCGQVS